ncbi:MAG: PKD domain-containing protein [Methylococcales bacterium]
MQVKYRFWLTLGSACFLACAWSNAQALIDLSSKISVVAVAPVFDARTGDFVISGTLHNVTDTAIAAPITLVIESLTPADTSLGLLSADGAVPAGHAYKVVLAQGELAANADAPFSLRFGFANPASGFAVDALEKTAKKAFKFTVPVAAAFTANYQVTQIPANNHQPLANAGTEQLGLVGATISLDGQGSTDADGHPLGYAWTLTEHPIGSLAKLSAASESISTLIADTPGVYEVSLVVNDGFVLSKPSTVKITAFADGTSNHTPKITSTAINSGTATREYSYQVTAADADGDPLVYRLVEFPEGMSISAQGAIQWNVPNREHEHMPVTVEVSDGRGGVNVQKFSIHIMPCSCA